MVGCFGVDSGFSPSVIWGTTRRYKPVEGVSVWLDHRIRRDRRNGFICRVNAQCGQEVQGSASADWEQKAFCWFVVAEGHSASHEGGYTSSCR